MVREANKDDLKEVLDFYKNAGYNCADKTAFIQKILNHQITKER